MQNQLMTFKEHLVKITMKQFEEFEKEFFFEQIKNPYYRLGQAFLNKFPEIDRLMEEDGDLGRQQSTLIWNEKNREHVLELLDWYIIK